MTRDDIIRMAQKAGIAKHGLGWTCWEGQLERFAALVSAAEREAMIEQGWRQCAKDQRTTQFCGMVEQAVLAEREACAKVCEGLRGPHKSYGSKVAKECANAIRARGQE